MQHHTQELLGVTCFTYFILLVPPFSLHIAGVYEHGYCLLLLLCITLRFLFPTHTPLVEICASLECTLLVLTAPDFKLCFLENVNGSCEKLLEEAYGNM